jgi:hypothetical protein
MVGTHLILQMYCAGFVSLSCPVPQCPHLCPNLSNHQADYGGVKNDTGKCFDLSEGKVPHNWAFYYFVSFIIKIFPTEKQQYYFQLSVGRSCSVFDVSPFIPHLFPK